MARVFRRGFVRPSVAAAFLFISLVLAAAAGDRPPGLSPAARRAADAFAAKDAEAMAAIAAAAEDDAFATVDELRAAGQAAAALALADAAEGAGLPRIAAFARRPFVDDAACRDALRVAGRSVESGSLESRLALLRRLRPRAGTLAAAEVPRLRGRLLVEAGREAEADEEYARAAEAARALGRDLDGEAEFLRRRFGPLVDDYALEPLERLARRLIDLHRMRRDIPGLAGTEADLGATFTALRLPGKALPLLERAQARLEGARRQASDPDEIWNLRWTCAFVDLMVLRVHTDVGNYPLALLYGERAVAEFRRLEDPIRVALALGDLGTVYSDFGASEEGLRLFEAALADLPEDDPSLALDRAMLIGNIGHAEVMLGRFSDAVRHFTDALAVPGARWGDHDRAIALLNLGEVRFLEGDPDGALAQFHEAKGLAKADPVIEAWAFTSCGDALCRHGTERDPKRLEEARRSFEEAERLLAGITEPTLRMLLATSRAELLIAQGRPAEAVAEARSAMEILDGLTGGLSDGETMSARGTRDRGRLFRAGVRAAAAAGNLPALFEMIERGRAQAFLASLGGRAALRRALLSPVEAAALEETGARVAAAYQRLRAATPSGRLADLRPLTRELEECRREHTATLQRVERSSRLVGGGCRPALASLPTVLAGLAVDEAIVLYVLDPEESSALILTRDGARRVALPPAGEIEAACAAVGLSDPSRSAEEILGRIDEASRLLLAPLNLPGAVRRLVVSPDGPLARLPWPLLAECALGPDGGAVLTPSATTWFALRPQTARTGRHRLALGDPAYGEGLEDVARRVFAGTRPLAPLPGTGDEVRAVTGDGDVRLLGADATEGNLRRAIARAERWSAIHLACHGLPSARDPSLSALAFTPTETEDGFFTALEVYSQFVNADLVVLSACESGADAARSGEGLAGLTRAFLLAGAPRVLASVARVDDEATRHFMQAFYEEWAKPESRSDEALRRAREKVRKSRPHPSAWGAFVLWGVPD